MTELKQMKKETVVKYFSVLVTILVLVVCSSAWAAEIGPYSKDTAEADGRLIAETVKDFNKPKQDLTAYTVMTLKSGNTVSDTRKVIMKQITAVDLSRYLFRFTDSIKRGLTFLTIETNGPFDDQYLYTPAIGRPRQVASQDRQSNFEDTDLTNEDMGGVKLDDYTYTRGRDTTLGGTDCYKVTTRSKDSSARFPKRIIWVARDTFVPVQVKVYNQDNQLNRVIVAGDIKAIGGINIPYKTVVKDMKTDHTTILEVQRADVNTGIDPLGFAKDNMGGSWKEQF